MAGAAGLEPVTSAVTGQRSNQLSYAPACCPECLRQAREPKEIALTRQAENTSLAFEFQQHTLAGRKPNVLSFKSDE